MLYLLRSGCQWRMLAEVFRKWRTGPFVLPDLEPTTSGSAPAWAGSTGMARNKQGRNARCTSWMCSASKTVIQPIKRGMTPPRKFPKSSVILPLTRKGFAHGAAVTTAEMPDRKDALFALKQEQTELRQVQCALCESSYVGTPFNHGVRDILGPQVKVGLARRTEPATFKVMLKRGVVERSMAWLEKHRRVWKNCEHRRNTRVQCMRLAFRTLLLR